MGSGLKRAARALDDRVIGEVSIITGIDDFLSGTRQSCKTELPLTGHNSHVLSWMRVLSN